MHAPGLLTLGLEVSTVEALTFGGRGDCNYNNIIVIVLQLVMAVEAGRPPSWQAVPQVLDSKQIW